MNYAETLTYWYFRLNGFFLIQNFVLHRDANGDKASRSADTDLLGVRPPYVSEEINSKPVECDPWLKATFSILERPSTLGLVIEVKSGETDTAAIERSFSQERIKVALRRLGFVKIGDKSEGEALANLRTASSFNGDGWVLAKVLVHANTAPQCTGCNLLSLSDVERFIQDRFRAHKVSKSADRLFFPDELIQYLAWKAKL